MNNYSLKIPSEIFAGKDSLGLIPQTITGKFSHAIVFTDQKIVDAGLLKTPLKMLKESEVSFDIIDDLKPEPSIIEAQKIINKYRESKADLIVAVGGGSVIDIAKLASVCSDNCYTITDIIKTPEKLTKQVQTLMIPTTAGTGAEATPNAIVTDSEQALKIGIVSKAMIADYVFLDGEMIRNLPKPIAASTGIDALCHALECFTSNKANPFSNFFALESIKLIFRNIVKSVEDRDALEEKSNMLLASFYAGVSITSSGTTAVHALSYPLGGKYHIPHGISNAIMLMPVLRFNRDYCLSELAEVYNSFGMGEIDSNHKKADFVLSEIEKLIKTLKIPANLSNWDISKDDLEDLVSAGMNVQRLLNNNKRIVTAEDARELYSEIL